MKIDFDQVLNSYNGKPLTRPADDADPEKIAKGEKVEEVSITLGWACCGALTASTESDLRTTGQEKVRRFTLAQKVFQGGELELPAADVALLQQRIGEVCMVTLAGAALLAIEPPTSA